MSRKRHRHMQKPVGLHDEAYTLQQGEFYPEHHEANIRRLKSQYPDVPAGEIDAIYRQACRIDVEVQQQVGSSQLSDAAKIELLDWLNDHFYGFGKSSFLQAILRAESK